MTLVYQVTIIPSPSCSYSPTYTTTAACNLMMASAFQAARMLFITPRGPTAMLFFLPILKRLYSDSMTWRDGWYYRRAVSNKQIIVLKHKEDFQLPITKAEFHLYFVSHKK